MPNTGKPSKDCHLCRSRRVKCDLARPACQRCIKYGAQCPGYRDEQALVFRNANPTNIKKRKKRSNPDSSTTSETGSSTFTSPSPTTVVSDYSTPSVFLDGVFDVSAEQTTFTGIVPLPLDDTASLILPQSLPQHWTAHSIPILLNVYSTLEFLHDIYRDTSHNGPLVWAAHLFSRTYTTNLKHSTAMYKDSVTETEQELGMYLGKTLSSVHLALKSPNGAMRDDVLATVWILANYELLMGSINRAEPMSPWHLHTRGLYSILKSRGTKWLKNSLSRASFWPAYNMVQIQCILTNVECPPETDEWFAVVEKSLLPGEVIALQVCIFVAKIAHVQARIVTILMNRDYSAASSEYHDLVGTMAKAEEGLTSFLQSSNYPGNEFDPYMRNMYNAACVKGYHLLLSYTNFLTHHIACPIPLEVLKALRKRCIAISRNSSRQIIESLPQTLDPKAFRDNPSPKILFDALKMIWPLTAVFVIRTSLPEHRAIAQESLGLIGRELGVRQALKVYPSYDPFPPEARRPVDLIDGEEQTYIPTPAS